MVVKEISFTFAKEIKNNNTMGTSNYAKQLVEDINNSKKKSIKFSEPIVICAEIRTDTEYSIDFNVCMIEVNKFSVKKNIFGEPTILMADGKHNITSISKDTYEVAKACLIAKK